MTAEYRAVLQKEIKKMRVSPGEAFLIFQDEAAGGDPEGLFKFGLLCEIETQSFDCFLKSAELGYGPAQHIVGLCYFDGFGVKENNAEAFEWFKKAAEQGIAGAQLSLGMLFCVGQGTEKNIPLAIYTSNDMYILS